MFYHEKHVRIRFVFIMFIIVILIIILRVFYIQVFDYKKLNKLANDLWSRNLPISASRGQILDRNGKILASNITTTSLYLVPNQIKNKEETAKKLSEILNVSYEEMLGHVTKKTSLERVHPEGRQLSVEVSDKINDLQIDGVYLLKEAKRYYPYGSLLAQTLGFVGIDNQGLSGLELKYNDYLTGKDGSIKYYSDAKGNKLNIAKSYIKETPGLDLTLTIDLDLQQIVERELDNTVIKYNPDHVIALAMDYTTGEILALASRPTFDSNNYKSASKEVLNRNLPIWMTYEPGSTLKITTLSASVNEGIVDLFKDTFDDSGSIRVENATLHCWKRKGHGHETYLQVVENSCNPGFVSLGLKLGKEKLFEYIKNYGFGSKTDVDLVGEENGIIFDTNKIGNVEVATTAFGQGISVTPIQQVRAVSASINGGALYKPYILKNISDSNTKNIILENKPTKVRQVIKKESSDLVKFALESVVANGTGRNAYIENYKIGGKTGTAQKVDNGHYMVGNYIVSFIGFLEDEKNPIVLYVAIDYPKGVSQYGGTVAAPLFKAIMKSYIDVKKIEKNTSGMPKIYNYNDKKYVILPDVKGKTLKEAQELLKGFNIEYSNQGDNVLYQSPEGNTYVEEKSSVKLLLN